MPLEPNALAALATAPRLLLKADLRPLQGTRFQPTGFPNLGPATYENPKNGDQMLLVESSQSITNWLERALFKVFTRDSISDDLVDEVKGVSFVQIDCGESGITSTLLEAHRLNTPYLWESADSKALALQESILKDLGVAKKRKKKGDSNDSEEKDDEASGRINMRRFYKALLKYDLNSLIHGVFLEKVAGRLRVPRALSGFVEASNVKPAESGGTKFDHVFPAKDEARGVTSKDGFTNIPYPSTQFAAESITAYFNLDLNQIRGYGLGSDAEQLLIALSLYKLARFRESVWDLRSNCKFEVGSVEITRPEKGFALPAAKDIAEMLPELIRRVSGSGCFGDDSSNGIRAVSWVKALKKISVELPQGTAEPTVPEELKKSVKWKKGTAKKGPSLELDEKPNFDSLKKLFALFPDNQSAKDAIRKAAGDGDQDGDSNQEGEKESD
ncbi:MAG: type I-U CRISPR-associated protein Cas7 [Fimbriimonadaceae bacterium]|nr:type I-U CRISPR-associated protein Cas7 [Fimbriimonadaceae bacterium]MBX3649324.1 type I-U CRISPR-associated protein Cas7 [Rhodocyclaceae bacterium]